jgi:gluconolactonase
MAWRFERVAGPFEGPAGGLAWDGRGMLFSVLGEGRVPDPARRAGEGRILRFDPASGEVSVWRAYTNRADGIAFSPDGELYACQALSRRVVCFRKDGSMALTQTLLDGRHHNEPNNLAIDSRGRIWFSDPWSELRASGPQIFPPLEHASVLLLEKDASHSWRLKRMTFDTSAPRAVALSLDEKTLYVAEGDQRPQGAGELRAYPLRGDGTLGSFTLLHSFASGARGIEGMCVDRGGSIVACAAPYIYVFAPSGAVRESHPFPAGEPMNCGFGEEDLYVTTAAGELWRRKE